MSLSFLAAANLGSVRWAKSSQGNRRGTCGWITSFFIFYFSNFHSLFFSALLSLLLQSVVVSHLFGPVVKPGYNASLARRRLRVQNWPANPAG